MGSYNRDDRSGGQRSFGRGNFGRPSFRGNDGPREMFKAVCGKCGKDCEVPFRPSGDRPVYCSDCFQSNRGENDSRNYQDRGPRPNFQRSEPRPQNNEQLGEISRKLDRIIDMLTVKSTSELPIEVQEKVVEVKEEEVVVPEVKVEKKKKASKKVAPEVKE